MGQRHTIDRDIEARGVAIDRIIDGLSELSDDTETRGRAIFRSHGIENTHSDVWYPIGNVIDALEELVEDLGHDAVVRLGAEIPKEAAWPDVDTVYEGFESINEAYHMNHRGGEVGHYEFTQTGDRKGVVRCENPYPCPFVRGIIKGTLWAFSHQFKYKPMILIRETSDRCRMDGGQQCEYHVSW